MWTPSYYKLTNVFNPPRVTVNDVMNYYTIVHEFYIEDENYEMNVDSENSESNASMQISSDENDKMSVDINVNDKMQEKLEKLYYQINSVVNGFSLKHGDIVEFPNEQMYFYHNPCIRIN
jgi:hypothetical protein